MGKSFDWKSLVGSIAPTIATALGGPLAGVATKAISTAVLGKDGGTDDEIAQAIATGGTDILVKIKEAEHAFDVRMKELDIDLIEIAAKDRDSARGREVKTKDKTPRNLAYIYTLGFFVTLAAQFYLVISQIIVQPSALRMLDATTGILFAMMLGSKEYYFGSSAGSSHKNDTIHEFLNAGGK